MGASVLLMASFTLLKIYIDFMVHVIQAAHRDLSPSLSWRRDKMKVNECLWLRHYFTLCIAIKAVYRKTWEWYWLWQSKKSPAWKVVVYFCSQCHDCYCSHLEFIDGRYSWMNNLNTLLFYHDENGALRSFATTKEKPCSGLNERLIQRFMLYHVSGP